MPQRGSLLPYRGVLSFRRKHGRHRAVKRREFITLLGGAAAAWPFGARAQQSDRVRRIGVFAFGAESDPAAQSYVRALRQGLEQLGWIEGRNIHVDYRWASGDRLKAEVAEMVELAPRRHLVWRNPVNRRYSSGRPEQYPSFSCMLPTRSPAVWLRAWRGPAETSRASRLTNPRSARNG